MTHQDVAEYNARVAEAEASGCVIQDGKLVPVTPGSLEFLFSGTNENPINPFGVPIFWTVLKKPFAYLISDDRKRWRLWCPCTAHGAPVCVDWNPDGLPNGVDLDDSGKPLFAN